MRALLIVDLQKDFLPGGPLATDRADELVPVINALMDKFSFILATKDWHPKDHVSFASNHLGKNVGDLIEIEGAEQVLWPVHCVQDTKGANFAEGLNEEKIGHVFYKGLDRKIDSYSAFFDNAKERKTGLEDYLRSHEINEIVVVGVATDYCVLYSVLDALELGFKVTVVVDGCRAINLHPDDESKALALMQERGALICKIEEVV